ncbi:helix-turn-helix transcriptional regulator [Mucilaginibacter mali]|uniref:Helix-turn-helix transcriptional regulator n=1 Tax=Mucilaginibacter mali TaxID=2740462 RepID=A0A7D4QF52_9SPHI|nr:helix-turn-helix transcriptional regulator [Mucilaginibacter mali]
MNKPKHPNSIREHRLARGLTQRELSDTIGLRCESRLSRWENGLSLPSATNLLLIASSLRAAPEEILAPFPRRPRGGRTPQGPRALP